jgi:hypothetical protein
MLQLTLAGQHQLSEGKYPIYVVDKYEDINQYLDQAEWLFVETAGDIVINRDHIWNKLHNIDPDVGVIGHLIWYPEDSTPHLHEQCFILNTNTFRGQKLNFTDTYKDTGQEFVRGQGDMNCGHAPLSITLSENSVSREIQFGTKVMEQSLTKGYRVINFDAEWRYPSFHKNFVDIEDLVDNLDLDKDRFKLASRGFFYPTTDTELFEKCLKSLSLSDDLEETQKLIISILGKFLSWEYVNMWQWDSNQPHIQADVVICPANGLLGENMALTSNAKKIIFYDINHHNIEFKKDLYANWDGNDYDKFVLDWSKDKDISIEPLMESDLVFSNLIKKETVEQLFPIWNSWRKSINLTLLKVDILDDLDKILEHVNDNTLLHTSTIFTIYPMTHIRYSREDILLATDKIENTVSKYNNCFWKSTRPPSDRC